LAQQVVLQPMVHYLQVAVAQVEMVMEHLHQVVVAQVEQQQEQVFH
jgi:hypothetical protein